MREGPFTLPLRPACEPRWIIGLLAKRLTFIHPALEKSLFWSECRWEYRMTFNSLRWPHSRLNGANHQRVRHFTLVYRRHHSQTTPSPPPSRALGTIICGSLIPPPALPCTLDSPAASAASHDSHLADSAESPVNSPASPLSSIAVRSPVEYDKPHHDVGVDISGRHLFRRAVRKIHAVAPGKLQPQGRLHCRLQVNVELRLGHASDERCHIQWFSTSYKSFDRSEGRAIVEFSSKTRGSSTRQCVELQIGEPCWAIPLPFRCEISIWETPWRSCNTLAVRILSGKPDLSVSSAVFEMWLSL